MFESLIQYLSAGLANFAPVFILLGLLIFVHELGHFWVARLCGVRVETFSMGFGKKIFRYAPGDTAYCLSIIPLGGYVKMYGDDPTADIPLDQRRYAFLHKPVLQRIAIVVAGPLMNLFFAFLLFMVIGRIGEEVPSAKVGDIPEHSQAASIGFKNGDKILRINQTPINSWLDVQRIVEHSSGQTLDFEVERSNGSKEQLFAPVQSTTNENILSFHSEVGGIQGLSNESLASVVGVKADSVAAKAGLNSLDLVTEVNGKPVGSFSELEDQIRGQSGQLTLKVRNVQSDEKSDTPDRTVHITLSNSPADLTSLGIEPAEMYVMRVVPDSPAFRAGLLPKDRIVAINGKPAKTWNDVLTTVKSYNESDGPVKLTVVHGQKQTADELNTDVAETTVELRPELTSLMSSKGQEERRFTIGVISGALKVGSELTTIKITDPVQLVEHGIRQSIEWTGIMVMSIVRLVQGEVSAKNIGGIISIGRVASRSFEIGVSSFLKTMSILSINLFLLNLLPVPVLDGGHLVFFTVEAIKGSPISLRKLAIAQQVGLTLLIMLMAFAFFNDISNLFANHW